VTLHNGFKRFWAAGVSAMILSLAGIGVAHAAGPGPEVCQGCHEDKVAAYQKSVHGQKAHPKAPANAGECSTCHGDATEHVKAGGGRGVGGIRNPGSKAMAGNESAEICIGCHKRDANRSHWQGSTHQLRDIACASCHSVHAAKDRVLSKATQFEVCFTCHKEQRSQQNRPSRHAVLEGKVACSDCHNPHGSAGPKLMKKDSVVETCFQCHAEKRGPFVHNHQPVTEDCTLCHNPHGTVAENMLKVRPPFLCHQCHTPHGGFVPQLAGAQVPSPGTVVAPLPCTSTSCSIGKSGTGVTQARGCLNCHTQVHGSNNPSTVNPTPQFMLR